MVEIDFGNIKSEVFTVTPISFSLAYCWRLKKVE